MQPSHLNRMPSANPRTPMYRQSYPDYQYQGLRRDARIPTQNTFLSGNANQVNTGGGMSIPVPPPKMIPPNSQMLGQFRMPYYQQNNTSLGSYPMRYNNNYSHGVSPYSSYSGMPVYDNIYNNNNNYSISQEMTESTREAFEGVDSFVRMFGSITMMLDSTYQAVYQSFQAFLSVADHFSHMKSSLRHIFSAVTIFKTVTWCYRKLLYYLGLRREDAAATDGAIWDAAINNATANDSSQAGQKRSWPIFLLLAVIYAGPLLIWKAHSKLSKSNQEASASNTNTTSHRALVLYNYNAETPYELSVAAGQLVDVSAQNLQRDPNWIHVSCSGNRSGVVPYNFIRMKALGPRLTNPTQCKPASDPGRQVFPQTANAVAAAAAAAAAAATANPPQGNSASAPFPVPLHTTTNTSDPEDELDISEESSFDSEDDLDISEDLKMMILNHQRQQRGSSAPLDFEGPSTTSAPVVQEKDSQSNIRNKVPSS